MFEDSLLESGGPNSKLRRRSPWATLVSFLIQAALVGVLVLIPLIYTEALPKQQLMGYLIAPPPPPPPPPPPAAAQIVKVAKPTTEIDQGQLKAPTAIPKKIAIIHDEAPPSNGGVVGGVVGGVPGGQAGGVIGGVSAHRFGCTDGRPQGSHTAAHQGFSRCDPGSSHPQSYADISPACQTGTHLGCGGAAGGDWERWLDSKSESSEWAPHADPECARRRSPVEV